MSKAKKGSKFERDTCRTLSLWWTGGERDDVFWRTGGSGGRAKLRGRRGVSTYGQHGDIAATDPIGDPLIDVFTIELKRGYSKHTIQDLLDKPRKGARPKVQEWIDQAIESWEQAGSFTWLLIFRRDKREALVIFPTSITRRFWSEGTYVPGSATLRLDANNRHHDRLTVMSLADFLALVKPRIVIARSLDS